MKRFSVIIPAYNAQATLRRCLDSVYALPVPEEEFEVIAIDDCSVDGTVAALQEYGRNHADMTVLVQSQNHRQGAARNRGLSRANGEWVIFLDSDDELAPGVVRALERAEQERLDMVAMKGVSVDLEGKIRKTYELPYPEGAVFSGKSLQVEHPFWACGPVLYAYRKSFLDRVDYPFAEDVLYEDSDFVNVHLYQAERMGYSPADAYLIHENPVSTTRTISYKHVCDYALLGTRLLRFFLRIDAADAAFADLTLEGGSFNIMKAFRALLRLGSQAEVRAFYDRLDAHVDRKDYLHYRKPAYCWTRWTRFCLKHRRLATALVGGVISSHILELRKAFKKQKHA